MAANGLVSNYTIAHFKVHKSKVNESQTTNVVNREFDDRELLEVVVSDLTYVRVNGKWNYVCLILDLHNREIIGHSAGKHKTASLVYEAFASIKHDLKKIKIFHTDYAEKNTIPKFLLNCFKRYIYFKFFGIAII